jgi:hypothetical protein
LTPAAADSTTAEPIRLQKASTPASTSRNSGAAPTRYQLVSNVRRFKGAPAQSPSPANHTIDIAGDFAQWQKVSTAFQDHVGETIPRDFDGVQGLHYTNKTGRNDIVETKVCRDASHVYFWVRTREPLTPSTDANWMWLLVDRDQKSSTGWNGFDLIVNRTTGVVELHQGGWKWKEIGKVETRQEGDQLQLALPVEALRTAADSAIKSFDFKWIDNLEHTDDPLELYISGDTAPDGRFRYRSTFE